VNDSHLIEELLGLLQKMHEERGVPQGESLENKNILQGNSPSDPNNRVSPALNSNERRRTSEIATLFAKTFVEYNKKYKKDEKPRTLISQTRGRLSSPPPLPEDKKGKGMLGMILGGLALLGASIGGIIASISGFFGDTASKVIEAVSKLGFLGALKVLSQTILKKLSLKVLKKLPFIGGLIGFYFAYKEFKAGNIFKGLAELVSAFLNFIPGIGFMLSIGADLLIAWADNKGMFSEGGSLSPENGWKTIKGWMSTIGKTIMDNALYLPVIGTFKRFGMAYDAFKGGNIGEGLKQVGLGILTLGGGGAIIKGVEVLAGWMDSAKEPEGSFQKDNSWLGRIKKWIVSKLNDLPEFLKVPMRWFGILDDGGNTGVGEFGAVAWKGAKDGTKMVSDFVGDVWKNIKEASQIGFDYIKEKVPNIVDNVKAMFSKVFDGFRQIAKSVGDWIKNLNPLGDGGELTESQKAARAKAAGYSSWREYEKSGWVWKTGNVVVDKAVKDTTTFGSEEERHERNERLFGEAKARQMAYKRARMQNVPIQDILVDKAVKSNSIKYYDDKFKDKTDKIKLQSMSSKDLQVESITQLKEAAKIQIKLLGEISHWGKLSLMELKRMSGGGGGNSNVSVNASMPSPPSQSLEMLGDNRNGYASSVYALA
jgi:hypothetical protein